MITIDSGNGLSSAGYQAIAWTNKVFCQLISQEQTSVKYGSKREDFH